jgi:hypothetical protein
MAEAAAGDPLAPPSTKGHLSVARSWTAGTWRAARASSPRSRSLAAEAALMGPEILRMLKQAERGLAVDEAAPERRVRFLA